MKYRTLGRTGIKVSPYCLGAMMFGGIANSDHDECIRIIHKALDFGINFVDTADRYSNGESEEIVGKALKDRRQNIVLATKVNGAMGEDPNQQGNSRRWITQAVEASLRRLRTDHIDLYQIHRPSPDTDIEETFSVLTDLIREGKVRTIGSSTFPASEIVEAQWVAEYRGLARFRTEQPPYSILNRSIEQEVLSFLAGRWSGPVTVTRGPGEPLHLTQTEKVEYKLDGLILLVEGKSTGTDGKAQFQALATIAFDNASHAYRIRAYHDGNYVDTELTVLTDGFSWGFTAGPAHIVNTMHLTNNGEWQEVTGVTVGNAPQRHSMDMLLERQP
jgi:hypothetical protein